jgi:hypothetical protein
MLGQHSTCFFIDLHRHDWLNADPFHGKFKPTNARKQRDGCEAHRHWLQKLTVRTFRFATKNGAAQW